MELPAPNQDELPRVADPIAEAAVRAQPTLRLATRRLEDLAESADDPVEVGACHAGP